MSIAMLESLEGRRLLHGGLFDLHVNFQPAGAVTPSDYVADTGAVYGARGNGYTYGWDASNTTATRERNVNADQRYDTFIHTQAFGTRTWEVQVPNGLYTVHVVAGDPSYNDSVYKINVEGVLTVNGTPTSAKRFVEGTQQVNVTDGKLTISNAAGAVNNKIAFLEIDSEESAVSLISVSASDASAGEGGNTGTFTFTRTGGDLAEDLEVHYLLGGSATNGTDYAQLLGVVTFPANVTTMTVTINPIDDGAVEGAETVNLTVVLDVTYQTVAPGTASITIADNDSPAGGGFNTKMNFQPAASTIPGGYIVDAGNVYGARNGLTYGWSGDNTSQSRDRNLALSPDQRYDTLVQFNGKTWDLAVPNGTYAVHIVSGDPGYFDSVYRIDAEGVRVIDGTPNTGNRWVEGTALVTVSDGKLTLTSPAGALNNKINFIEVTTAAPGTPIITVSAPATNASENGTTRAFTITRTGDTTQPLTINYTIGGSATNGVDYNAIANSIVIPAGQATVEVTVMPIDDAIVDATETVTLTLVSQSGYAIGAQSNATIRINDNDTPVGNTITWTTRAGNPIVRAEALKAVVDGKLYVFGGFSGDLGPVKRSDVYDPVANTWAPLPDMPTRVTHAGVAVDGHDIYIAGGYVGIGATGYGQTFGVTNVWKYNIDTKQYTAFTALPKAIAGGGLVLLGRELHWIGGNNNQRQDIGDHYVFNLDNPAGGWTTSTSLPSGRSHLGTVVLGGKIYAIGGQFGNDEGLTTKKLVHVWDPANPGAWTQLADLPTAISHIASATVVLGNRIMVFGGETAHNQPTDLVYAYDTTTNTWSAMTKLPATRFSGVAGIIDGNIYFTTGSSQTTTWKGVIS